MRARSLLVGERGEKARLSWLSVRRLGVTVPIQGGDQTCHVRTAVVPTCLLAFLAADARCSRWLTGLPFLARASVCALAASGRGAVGSRCVWLVCRSAAFFRLLWLQGWHRETLGWVGGSVTVSLLPRFKNHRPKGSWRKQCTSSDSTGAKRIGWDGMT